MDTDPRMVSYPPPVELAHPVFFFFSNVQQPDKDLASGKIVNGQQDTVCCVGDVKPAVMKLALSPDDLFGIVSIGYLLLLLCSTCFCFPMLPLCTVLHGSI